MSVSTTVIGSFPKPDYLRIPDWARTKHSGPFVQQYNEFMKIQSSGGNDLEALIMKAIKEVLDLQSELGIDVLTDGEIRRESYVHYFCRRLEGFDFEHLASKSCRNGAVTIDVPVIVGEVKPQSEEPWVAAEWKESQAVTQSTVKITLPGPMTIINSVENRFYNDEEALGGRLAKILNKEILSLVEQGCKSIQIDEPVLVRSPEKALSYGIDQLKQCFDGVPETTVKCVHLCCGYPDYLDQEEYEKADKEAYLTLADKLDAAGFDEISIEDAHRHNDLSLFQRFKNTKVVVGVIKAASSRVESVEEIRSRLQQILTVLPADRLVVAPDCGLAFLPRHLALQKLTNMDQEGYEKADKEAYLTLADKLDAAGFDEISIEDAHRHNDLSLFQRFKNTKVVVGVVKAASSRVETVEEIRSRLQQILTVLPADRLVVAPDCRLAFLPRHLALQKLTNMVTAAKSLP